METLWAFDLGKHRYRLDSTPWLQYAVSYMDVVEALPDNDGMLCVTRVLEKSGHRTVRVHAEAGIPQPLIDQVIGAGCSVEGANRQFVAFDIPPGVALDDVTAILVANGVDWEHADPTYEQVHGHEP